MEIKQYKTGDEAQILELFKLAFNKEMTPEYWKWRFQDNPFTKDIMIHLMWDGDKMVGHYAICPIEMVIDGEVCMTAFSMTTMTHPEYNGRGIFTQLSSSLYEELKTQHGYKMVWGFPNNNSHYAFIKNLKWNNVATLPMLSLSKAKLKAVENLQYSVVGAFDEGLASKLNTTSKKIKINKTADYLNWRYNSNPFAEYKTITVDEGVAVYKVIPSFSDASKREIDVMELAFNNDAVLLNDLVNAIITEEKGADIIQFNLWSSIFSDEYLTLKKSGFVSQMPITYLGFLKLASESQLPEQYQNWDMNFGYSDVF